MFRSKLMIWVAVLVLLVAGAGCAADLERTVEETITIQEQPTEETILDPEQPVGETEGFTITGWVTVDAYHYDEATGTYIHFYHDESSNIITTIGLNFIEEHLGIGGASYDDPAKWISLSNDAPPALVGWTQLPVELDNTNGLGRAEGAYLSTGDGVWTISKTFTATGPVTVQMTGLQWLVTLQSNDNLMAANDFTQVVLATDDSLTITWTITLS